LSVGQPSAWNTRCTSSSCSTASDHLEDLGGLGLGQGPRVLRDVLGLRGDRHDATILERLLESTEVVERAAHDQHGLAVLAGALAHLLEKRLRSAPGERHRPALAEERQGRGSADAASGAGHDRDPARRRAAR
jgi:hypothetical protein